MKNDSEFAEETSEIDNKKPKTEKEGSIIEISNPMDIDQSEASTNKNQESSITEENLLSSDEIEKASNGELKNLIKRVKEELAKRDKETKENQGSGVSNYQVSTQELKDTLQKSERLLNSYQSPSLDNKGNDGKVGIVASIVGISTLAIGGIILVKSKLGKRKKS